MTATASIPAPVITSMDTETNEMNARISNPGDV